MQGNKRMQKRQASVIGKITYALMVGLMGTLLVTLFLLTFLHPFEAVRFVPWIFGFTSALTGYNLIQRAGQFIRNKSLFCLGTGLTSAILVFFLLNLLFFYFTSATVFGLGDLLLFSGIGMLSCGLGALLALKYVDLKKKT